MKAADVPERMWDHPRGRVRARNGVFVVQSKVRSPRRSISVLVVALVASLSGLGAAPATAVDLVSLSGRVQFPSDFRARSQVNVVVRSTDASFTKASAGLTPSAPTFAFPDLAAGSYTLQLRDLSGQLHVGYLADEDGSLDPDDPLELAASASDLVLRPTMSQYVDGTVALPKGFTGTADGEVLVTAYSDRGPSPHGTYPVAPDGTFRAAGMESGTRYTLRYEPSVPGLVGGWYSAKHPSLVAESAASAVKPMSVVTLRPRASVSITGTVKVPPGLDPAEARVRVQPLRWEKQWWGVEADGSFRVEGLDPDATYTFAVEYGDYSENLQYLGEHGGPTTRVEAAALLRPRSGLVLEYATAAITGKILSPDGAASSSAWLRVDGAGDSIRDVSSDGSFVVENLTPGEPVQIGVAGVLHKTWWFAGDGRALVRDQSRAAWLMPGSTDVALRFPPAPAPITGRLEVDPSAGVSPEDVRVALHEVGDPVFWPEVDEVAVEADATFTLRPEDAAREYVVALSAVNGATAVQGYLSPAGTVVPSPVDGVRLEPGATGLRVPVQAAAGGIAVDMVLPDGLTDLGPKVEAVDRGGVVVAKAERCETQVADPGAPTCELQGGIAAGEGYAIRVSAPGLATTWYAGEGVPGVPSRSSATLVEGGRRITVSAATGAALTGWAVRPYPTTVDVIDAQTGELVHRSRLRPLRTDFEATGVSPGSYVIGVDREDGPSGLAAGYLGADGAWVPDRGRAAVITVGPAGRRGLEVPGATCASYSGVVDEEVDGEPVRVRLWADGLPARSWTGAPGEDEFTVTGLGPGRYHVGVRVGSAPEQRYGDVTVTGCTDVTGRHLGSDPRVRATKTPSLTAGTQVGDLLTVKAGLWSPAATSVRYQWFSGGAAVPGAMGSTYRIRPTDLGRTVSVRLTVSGRGVRSATTTVSTKDVVTRGTFWSGPVTFTSTLRVGVKARAVVPWDAERIEWQWMREGVPIAGATAATYTPVPADEGRALWVLAYGTRRGFTAVSSLSATLKPRPAFESTAAPTLSGKAAVGRTVSTTWGSWSLKPDKVTYQWLRDGVAISGATGSSYTPVAADKGKKLKVRLTAQRSGQPKRTVESAARTVQAGTITMTRKPSLSGTAKIGQTLKTDGGAWTPKGVKLRYQWLRNGSPISGATRSYYKVVAADRGRWLQVRVTAQLSGYAERSMNSAKTPTVR